MSVVKHFSKDLYPSVQDAVLEILDEHIVSEFGGATNRTPIYGSKALDEVLGISQLQNSAASAPASSAARYSSIRCPLCSTLSCSFMP